MTVGVQNPFKHDRLNGVGDYRPEWDVPSLHDDASDWLAEALTSFELRHAPDPSQKIRVLRAAPGYGKTHLFGRINHRSETESFLVYVPQLETIERPLDHLRRALVNSLFEPRTEGRYSTLQCAMARLCQSSFADYFDWLPQTVAARHMPFRSRLSDNPLAVLDLVDATHDIQPYLKLSDSILATETFPTNLDSAVVRALTLGWAPHPIRRTVHRWLAGESLPERDLRQLELGEEPPGTTDVYRAIAALLQYEVPTILCCDQLETILKDRAATSNYADALVQLLQHVPNLMVVVGCLDERWDDVKAWSEASFAGRCEERTLAPLSSSQGMELLHRRLGTWNGRRNDRGDGWPFDERSVMNWIDVQQVSPRALLKTCADKFDDWLNDGQSDATIDLQGGPVRDLEQVFREMWDNELLRVRSDSSRSPEELSGVDIHTAFQETIQLFADADDADEALPRIADLENDVISQSKTGSHRRYSLAMTLGNGEQQKKIVLSATTAESGQVFAPYFKEFEKAQKKRRADGVLIHHQVELPVKSGKALEAIDSGRSTGTLRTISLLDHLDDFQKMDVFRTLLREAAGGNLTYANHTLSEDDCCDLVLRLQLLDNLKLLRECFSGWVTPANATHTGQGQTAHVDSPPSSSAMHSDALQRNGNAPTQPAAARDSVTRQHVAAADAHGTVSPLSAHKAASPNAASASTASTKTSSTSTASASAVPTAAVADSTMRSSSASRQKVDDRAAVEEWVQARLQQAVQQLGRFNVRVEAMRVETGPTFARLLVQPLGNTTIKKVLSKAVDLKIRLGLEAEPMIDAQAGSISIDVELPSEFKRSVSLGDAFVDDPRPDSTAPWFPVGQDVSGQTHWADLSDSNSSHFLVAGQTGSGKSVLLQSIVASLCRRLTPDQLQLVLVDPKRLTFNFRNPNSPYFMRPIAYTESEALDAIEACFAEMEKRYKRMQPLHVQNLAEWQQQAADAPPRIVLICDEFADLMTDKTTKPLLETPLKRLGAKARAAGVHLILATQRPEATVVTPLLRSNLPGRIALNVATKSDSGMVLNGPEACNLLGKGDLLFQEQNTNVRLQSPYVSQDELEEYLRMR